MHISSQWASISTTWSWIRPGILSLKMNLTKLVHRGISRLTPRLQSKKIGGDMLTWRTDYVLAPNSLDGWGTWHRSCPPCSESWSQGNEPATRAKEPEQMQWEYQTETLLSHGCLQCAVKQNTADPSISSNHKILLPTPLHFNNKLPRNTVLYRSTFI